MDYRAASRVTVLLLAAAPLACGDDVGDSMDEVGDTSADADASEGEEESSTSESGTDDADTDATTDDEASTTESESDDTSSDDTTDATDESTDDATDTTTDTTTDDTTTTESSSDSGDCLMCTVTLDSTQSSSFEALQGTEFMGYATLQGDQIIYALDEVGTGRVIYTADTNILYFEVTDCPLWEWLGQTGDQLPKVLSFGRYLCDGLGNNLGTYPDLTYAGNNLPNQYIGNPALLAQDYDAVIYCTLSGTSQAEAQTIVDYVNDHSGGLYLASEYWGFINQNDLNTINTIANPLGVDFQATNLDWGQANGDIDFACFPEPQ